MTSTSYGKPSKIDKKEKKGYQTFSFLQKIHDISSSNKIKIFIIYFTCKILSVEELELLELFSDVKML